MPDSASRDLQRTGVRAVVRRTYHSVIRHRVVDAAASLTFFALLALVPTALALVSGVALFVDDGRDAVEEILVVARYILTPNAVESLRSVSGADSNGFDVALLHGSREDGCPPELAKDAPFSDAEVLQAPFAYIAAGHYHAASRITASVRYDAVTWTSNQSPVGAVAPPRMLLITPNVDRSTRPACAPAIRQACSYCWMTSARDKATTNSLSPSAPRAPGADGWI
jgi:hypothetical protein